MTLAPGRSLRDASGGGPTPEFAQERHAWRVLSVTSLGMTLAFLNTSTLNVALPILSRQFHATPAQATWLVLSYLLVNTALIPVFGRAADLVGRKKVYVLGLALITTASLASGFAPDAHTLIGLRAVQGIGGAAILANTTALLVDAFPERLLVVGLSLNVTAASAAHVLGPAVGGALVTGLGWRALFWFNVPVGVAALWWAGRTLHGGAPVRRDNEGFDYPGGLLTVCFLGVTVFVVSRGNDAGWTGSASVLLVMLSVGLFAALVIAERRARHPLIDVELFRSRVRSMAFAATTLMSVAQSAVALLVSLYFQAIQGASPLESGLWIAPLAGGMMVASPLAGRLATRIEVRTLCSAGFALTAVTLLIMALWLDARSSRTSIAIILAAMGIGVGVFQAPNTASLMAGVPPQLRGIASGLRSTLQSTGQVFSTAMCLAIVTAAVPAAERRAFYSGGIAGSTRNVEQFLTGFRAAFLVLFAICCVGVALSVLRGTTTTSESG